MKRRRFTQAEIAQALREVEAGIRVPEVCARIGVSELTLNRWRREAGLLGARVAAPLTLVPPDGERAASRIAALERRLEGLRRVMGALLEPEELARAARLLEAHLSLSAGEARRMVGLPPSGAKTAAESPVPASEPLQRVERS